MRSDTTPAGSRDLTGIWTDTCDRISTLVANLRDQDGDTPIPTVPGVTVRDALSHLVRITTSASDTPAAVRGATVELPVSGLAAPLTDLAAAWSAAAAQVRDRLDSDTELASVLITAAVMIEQDLRTTLGQHGARDNIAIKVALDELSGRFSDRVEAGGLPPLRVTVEQWGTIAGDGRATSCVVADRFEFVRAMSGRRSAPEIAQWNWGVDPQIYESVISEVGLPEQEIHERDPRIPEHMRDREFVL